MGILMLSSVGLSAKTGLTGVVCRADLSKVHRNELVSKLRKITGWTNLKFDSDGWLRLGEGESVIGSQSARKLIKRAMSGESLIVLEDASQTSELAFARVVLGKWKQEAPNSLLAFVVQIDFTDFQNVLGDRQALEAFNEGWVLLHELDHIVSDSSDPYYLEDIGECEYHINQMRRECDLPERSGYFFTFLPVARDSTTISRLVRLAFDQEWGATNKKKRYWLIWDANIVGGIVREKQIAILR